MPLEAIAERLVEQVPGAWRVRLAWAYRLFLLAILVAGASFSVRAVWVSPSLTPASATPAPSTSPRATGPWRWSAGLAWRGTRIRSGSFSSSLHALGLDLPVVAKWLGAALFAPGLGIGCAFIALAAERRPWQVGAIEAGFDRVLIWR